MNRDNKNIIIAIMLMCILTMAVGYSILQQRLNIEGTANVSSVWDIQVTGIREIGIEGLAETANLDFTPTSATYSTNLQAPGDTAIYEITVENKGTLTGITSLEPNILSNLTTNNDITIGILGVSKSQLTYTDYNQFQTDIYNLLTNDTTATITLKKDEKAYYYAIVELDSNITTLPENKTATNEIKFSFTQPEATYLSEKELIVTYYNSDCLPEGYNYSAKFINSNDYSSQQLLITISREDGNTNETLDSEFIYTLYDSNDNILTAERILQGIDIYKDSTITEKTYTIDYITTPDIDKFTYLKITGICFG